MPSIRVAVPLALASLVGVGLLCVHVVSAAGSIEDDPALLGMPRSPGLPAARPPAAVARRVAPDEGWVGRTASAAGIPAPAVRAYGRAVLLIQRDVPPCELGWTTLAGIGYVESVHGTIGQRVLGLDGLPSEAILGPALDGAGDVAAIPATPESVAWHGDTRWDHAVGPLQFIPSTWARWGSDGDADGVADPHDLDDAAYAAARYLCADGHDLESGGGWGAAVFSYNHAQVYVDAVRAAASAYADRTR